MRIYSKRLATVMKAIRTKLILSWLIFIVFGSLILLGHIMIAWLVIFPALVLIRAGIPSDLTGSKKIYLIASVAIIVLINVFREINIAYPFTEWIQSAGDVICWAIVASAIFIFFYSDFVTFNKRTSIKTEPSSGSPGNQND